MMKFINVILIVLFLLGVVWAVIAPNPITIGCAIFNGVMIGIAFALEYA